MFCDSCGKRMNTKGSKCSVCGAVQNSLTNGNGFWDLCDVPKAPAPAPAPVQQAPVAPAAPIPMPGSTIYDSPENQKARLKKKAWNFICIVVAIAFISMVLAGVFFSMNLSKKKTIADRNSEIDALNEDIVVLNKTNASLQGEYENMSSADASKAEAIDDANVAIDILENEIESLNTQISEMQTTEETNAGDNISEGGAITVANSEVENPILPGATEETTETEEESEEAPDFIPED